MELTNKCIAMSLLEEMNEYHGRNNAVPFMDSLLMNEQIIKSGMGYDTQRDPVVGDRYNTVNNIGQVAAVDGKSITIEKDPGFPNLSTETEDTIPVNSRKDMNQGTYSYRDGYGEEKSLLQQNLEIFNSQ